MVTRNSSISNSDRAWDRFFKVFSGSLCLSLVSLCLLMHLIDPYDSFSLSLFPNTLRLPVSNDQQFFHQMLARRQTFDSVIIGTSSTRMLRPEQLNGLLKSSFVNLGFNGSSPQLQYKLLELFVRHHREMKFMILGIDVVWFSPEKEYNEPWGARFPGSLPEWLFDENPLNDLLPFSSLTFKHAKRQLLSMTGLKDYGIGADGYTDIMRGKGKYDINKARLRIYNSESPKAKTPVKPPVKLSLKDFEELNLPALKILEACLKTIPDETTKIIYFVPYHYYLQPVPGSRDYAVLCETKRRIIELAKVYPNIHILDFMVKSHITTRDENYWDPLHYTVETATLVSRMIADGVKNRQSNQGYFRYMGP